MVDSGHFTPGETMKTLALAALLTLPTLARAEVVHCTASSHSSGQVRQAPAVIDYDRNFVEMNGVRQSFLGTVETTVTGLDDYLNATAACTKGDDFEKMKCDGDAMQKYFLPEKLGGTDEGMIRLGLVFLHIQLMAPANERSIDADFPLTKVRRGKMYKMGAAGRIGIPGLFEYFDEKNQLLGRFFIAGPYVMPCKSRSL